MLPNQAPPPWSKPTTGATNAVWRDDRAVADGHAGRLRGCPPNDLHWWELDTTTLDATTLTQQGDVGGEEIDAGAFTFMSSIAVDANGNMGIGFAVSGPGIFPSAGYTGRKAGDAAGATEPAAVAAAGLDYYNRRFGGARNRWGDYSGTSLDPGDERTFWVFNEYALARGTVLGSFPTEDGRWGTKWGNFEFNTDPSIDNTTLNADENQLAAGTVTATDIDGDTPHLQRNGRGRRRQALHHLSGRAHFRRRPRF